MKAQPAAIVGIALVAVALALSCGGSEGDSEARLRMVLAPEEGVQVDDLDQALDGARDVLERRLDEFGVAGASVQRTGSQLVLELPAGIITVEEAKQMGRTALLQFCEPVTDEAGNVAVVSQGTIQYQPQTCEPARDAEGDIVVEPTAGEAGRVSSVEFVPWPFQDPALTTDLIVWQQAKGERDGHEVALDGTFLRPNTFVTSQQSQVNLLGEPILVFEWESDGAEISRQVTERLSQRQLPLAAFLDGEPIRGEDGTIIAPIVQSTITSQGQLTGLSLADAEELSKLLNTGAFPIPLRVVEAEEVLD